MDSIHNEAKKIKLILHSTRSSQQPFREFSVFVKQLIINPDFAVGHIAEHIPMTARLVLATGVGTSSTHGQVNCAAYLFVIKHILGELFYPVIGADPPFAQITRSFVCIQ